MFNGVFQIIEKKKAEELGMRYFFNGKPCRNNGNIWLRNTSRGKCFCPDCKRDRRNAGYSRITPEYKEAKREKDKAYRQTERFKETRNARKQVLKNWGVKRVISEEQRLRNLEVSRLWVQENKVRHGYNQINNKVRKKYPDSFPTKDLELNEFVLMEAVDLRNIRKESTGHDWAVDHMIPLSKGGLHSWENIQLIPWVINIMKKDRLIFTKPYSWFDYA